MPIGGQVPVGFGLDFFAELPGRWEVTMTGGEPFAFRGFMERIVPGLIERPPTVWVLTHRSRGRPSDPDEGRGAAVAGSASREPRRVA